jgi:hypothetical protein
MLNEIEFSKDDTKKEGKVSTKKAKDAKPADKAAPKKQKAAVKKEESLREVLGYFINQVD